MAYQYTFNRCNELADVWALSFGSGRTVNTIDQEMDEKPFSVDHSKTALKRRGAKRRKGNPVKLPTKNVPDKSSCAGIVKWSVNQSSGQNMLRDAIVTHQHVRENESTILLYDQPIGRESVPSDYHRTCHSVKVQAEDKAYAALGAVAAKSLLCTLCDKSYSSKGNYQRHLRISRCGAERSYGCPRCGFSTSRKSTWLQHLAEIHHVDPDGNQLQLAVKCPDCDFVCVTKPRLTSHVRRKHTTDKPHKCAECIYSSITKCDLEKHVRIVHRNERPYMCETCGFCCKTVSGFNCHMRSHAGIRPFRCELCDKAFSRGARLKIHLQKHADAVKPYVCHFCGYACRRRDNLLVHLRRVHKEEATISQ